MTILKVKFKELTTLENLKKPLQVHINYTIISSEMILGYRSLVIRGTESDMKYQIYITTLTNMVIDCLYT